jgi:site-specific DNA-methyltransferase (adenine-specific)
VATAETVSGVTSHHGSAEDVLPSLESNSIDCILTDPPYFKVLAEDWDNQWHDQSAFLDWLDRIAAEWQRILAPNGSLYVFAWPDLSARVEVLLAARFHVLNRCRYQKTTARSAIPSMQRRWSEGWEACIFAQSQSGHLGQQQKHDSGGRWSVLTEPLRGWFRAELKRSGMTIQEVIAQLGSTTASHYFLASQWQMPTPRRYAQLQEMATERAPAAGPPAFRRSYSDLLDELAPIKKQWESEWREYHGASRRPFNAPVNRSDLWVFNPPPPGDERHPAEKPLPLLRHILSTSTRPGDLVLDCFAGRASTGAACIDLKRRAILVEQDEGWYRRGLDRLRDHALHPREARMAPIAGPLFDT